MIVSKVARSWINITANGIFSKTDMDFKVTFCNENLPRARSPPLSSRAKLTVLSLLFQGVLRTEQTHP